MDYMYPGESRVSRASVIKENGLYKIWYCYAIESGGYKMGYAESDDGFRFSRRDHDVGIDLSTTGWDSEMICYPYVLQHKGQTYMLYCGNGYGRTGFGYAMLAEE